MERVTCLSCSVYIVIKKVLYQLSHISVPLASCLISCFHLTHPRNIFKKDSLFRIFIGYTQAVHLKNIRHSGDWSKSTHSCPSCEFINFVHFSHFNDICNQTPHEQTAVKINTFYATKPNFNNRRRLLDYVR